MNTQTLYILFHGRFPSEKAAALFALKSAASFAKHMPVVLLVPRRRGRGTPEPLPQGVRAVYLPTLDLFNIPILERIAFPLTNIFFSLACLVYLFFCLEEKDIVDTNEALPAIAASLLTRNIIFEVHDFPERFHTLYSFLFKRIRLVLSTNKWKREQLIQRFALPDEQVLLERNGVDVDQFAPQSQATAREALTLSKDETIVVYTGHLYGWKGVETLAEAALLLPDIALYVVGGAPQDVARFVERYPAKNIHAVGYRPHDEIPLWQAAADVLVLPNTGEEEISAHYTSPMKLFEYMASGRPIVASNVPSIAEVLSNENAYLVAPDDAHALANTITYALTHHEESAQKATAAHAAVAFHAWGSRAERIFAAIAGMPQPREWFRTLTVCVAYLGLLGAVFFPFLFGQGVILGTDVTVYYYAAFDFYHKALTSGQSFLWNPLLFSGFPMYLSQVAGYFDPLNYALFHFFDGYTGTNIRLYIDYLLVLLLSFFAGRVWGISRIASFCIGLAYLLSLHVTVITNPLFANSAFLMPFLVWLFGKIRHTTGFDWKLSVVGGVLIGWAFLGGYAQIVIMYLVLFGLFGVLYTMLVVTQGKMLFFARFGLQCISMSVLGLVVGAPQIIPALAFAPLTRRGGGVDYSLASLKAIVPGDIILFLFPDYTYFPYLSVGRKCLYVGAFWFVVVIGYVRMIAQSLLERRKEMREPLVFLLVFLFALATAFTHSPIFYALQHLPVFNLFRFSDRWMYGGIFFLAMLGGYGLDALSMVRERYVRQFYVWASAAIGALLALIVFLNMLSVSLRETIASWCMTIFTHTLYGRGPFIKDLDHYRDATLRGMHAWQEFTSLHDTTFFWPTFLLALSLVLIWLHLLQKISVRAFRIGACAVMVVTFVVIVPLQIGDSFTQDKVASLNQESFMRFVAPGDAAQYRFYPVFIADGYQQVVPPTYRLTNEEANAAIEMAFSTGWPNTNFQYGMPSVDGYDVFVPNTYIDALALAGSTFGAQDYTRGLPLQEKIDRLNRFVGVIGMMGGKYVVSGIELHMPQLKLLGTYTTSSLQIPIYVYINTTALPTTYVANHVVEAHGQSLAALMTAGSIDFEHTTYLDCAGCASEAQGTGVIRAAEVANGDVQLRVEAKGNVYVVYSGTLLPGWEAVVDGSVVEIVRANGLYMAVRVPPGSHTVKFVYHGELKRGI
jgi:glycosyltransferase involved in cell wall biosynthesis